MTRRVLVANENLRGRGGGGVPGGGGGASTRLIVKIYHADMFKVVQRCDILFRLSVTLTVPCSGTGRTVLPRRHESRAARSPLAVAYPPEATRGSARRRRRGAGGRRMRLPSGLRTRAEPEVQDHRNQQMQGTAAQGTTPTDRRDLPFR